MKGRKDSGILGRIPAFEKGSPGSFRAILIPHGLVAQILRHSFNAVL